MPITRKLAAEFIGTFWLVLGGCGSAVLAAAFPHVGIGLLGVALAFGLTIVAMAYTIGDVSGCHLNPAVTFGLVLGGRHPAKEMLPYWVVQVLGGIAAAWILVFIAGGNGSDPLAGGLAANGCKSRAQYRPCGFRSGVRPVAALAVLGGTAARRCNRRVGLPLHHPG
jgi:aquaporin Z